ncbi:class I SAM-dependent methyltransferase [Lapidilactobacillus mulanensis]|uniref:Class I SAM-dependent methyltransferase n=1 Tax=Lapidilactobacillus mulanensis TaxID=2485999 RepID=A0ABW4DMB4_9LACO|nr:class I SAM-dependent methyltransferase [Lapidilactobacillus mulanensis]
MSELSDLQAAWDEFAPEYYQAERASQLSYVADVIKFLQRKNLLPQQLVDLGSGAGRFAIPFAQAGVQVQAVDFSQAMLDLLTDRLKQLALTQRVTSQRASWQDLIETQIKFPAVWLSMLPDVDAEQMLQLSNLATEQFMIFRLVEVRDDNFTPLLAELNLPPERPEIQPRLMANYQEKLQSHFSRVLTQRFHYQQQEQMSRVELEDYLESVLQLTPAQLESTMEKLQPKISADQLRTIENYTFELMIFQR